MIDRRKGENLTKERIKQIKENYIITNHAQQRMIERKFNKTFAEVLDNYHMAFYGLDASIYIYADEHRFFVVQHKIKQKKWIVITYNDNSDHTHQSPELKQFKFWLGIKRSKYDWSKFKRKKRKV